jgi:hypothetical protein
MYKVLVIMGFLFSLFIAAIVLLEGYKITKTGLEISLTGYAFILIALSNLILQAAFTFALFY